MKEMKVGTVIEVDEGGLMTKAEVVTDYGKSVHCRVLEHYFHSEEGTFRTYEKRNIWKVLKGGY